MTTPSAEERGHIGTEGERERGAARGRQRKRKDVRLAK